MFSHHLDLPERESSLIACFSISTWLADRLPTAPSLIISGPDQELGIDVLHLLSCVCRHPLMLAEVTPFVFRSLPRQLAFPLLLDHPGLKPNMQRLFRASSRRGPHLVGNRGTVVDLYGSKPILCGNDAAVDNLGGGVIHISATPSQSQPSVLDEQLQDEIADKFQPRLLMYRLKNFGRVRESPLDVSQSAVGIQFVQPGCTNAYHSRLLPAWELAFCQTRRPNAAANPVVPPSGSSGRQ